MTNKIIAEEVGVVEVNVKLEKTDHESYKYKIPNRRWLFELFSAKVLVLHSTSFAYLIFVKICEICTCLLKPRMENGNELFYIKNTLPS